MAVFTPISDSQASEFLQRFNLGEFVQLEEVASGTENSTFFLTTTQHELVLTLFEQGGSEELPFFVELMHYLASEGIPVTDPIPDKNGQVIQELAKRPALILPRLRGTHPMDPTIKQCRAIGELLGKMHRASQRFTSFRPNPRDMSWIKSHYQKVMAYLNEDDKKLMLDTFDSLEEQLGYTPTLPQGGIHGDLFRDNAMFESDHLTGIIDFYNACVGELLFDLAIVVNDWCSDHNGELLEDRYHAVLEGYLSIRPLIEQERATWEAMLKMTALRYWLSRLLVVYVDPPAHTLTPKDPTQYRNIVYARVSGQIPAFPG